MENEEMSQKEIVKFFYQKSTRRPKILENNVFVIYSPEKIKLQPGELKFVNMRIKIKSSKNIIGSCTILQSLSNYGLKLLNSNTISQEFNSNMQISLPLMKMTYRHGYEHSNYSIEILIKHFKLERNKKLGIFS